MNPRSLFSAFLRAWRPRWPRATAAAATEARESLPPALAASLEDLRRRHRSSAVVSSSAFALGLVCLCLVVQGLADWWFGLSWVARAVLLVLDLTALAWIYRVLLLPPLRVRLNSVDMARLVERRWPDLGQSLLTAAELAEGDGLSTSGSPQLAGLVLADAARRVAVLDLPSTVPLRRIIFPAAGAAVLCLATLVLAIAGGDASVALLQRIALLNAPRPTKTVVEPVTRHFFAARGEPVTLQCRARRLHPARSHVELALVGEPATGDTLEAREIEPRIFSVTVPSAQASFRYRFVLDDGRGEEFTVTVKDPPTFSGLELLAYYPAYTGLPPARLDPAKTEILAGSQLSIRATASTRLRSATVVRHGVPGTLEAKLDSTRTKIDATLPIPVRDLSGWSLRLVDEDGVASRNETVHPIEIIPDKPPKIEWVWPRSKRLTLTLQAKTDWVIKAADDFTLDSLLLHYQALPGDGDEAVPQPRKESIAIDSAPADGRFRHPLDFTREPAVWEVGRSVEYWAEAADGNDATGPGVSVTPRQQLAIVTPEAKTAELFARSRRTAAAIHTLAERHARATAETEEALRRDSPPPPRPNP